MEGTVAFLGRGHIQQDFMQWSDTVHCKGSKGREIEGRQGPDSRIQPEAYFIGGKPWPNLEFKSWD